MSSTVVELREGDSEDAHPRVFVDADGRPGPVRTLRCMIAETRLREAGHPPRWVAQLQRQPEHAHPLSVILSGARAVDHGLLLRT